MRELQGRRAANLDRRVIEPLAENERTLREHFRRKSAHYQLDTTRTYDRALLRVFVPRAERPHGRLASGLLREMRPQLRRLLVRRARMHPYIVDHVMRTATQRARVLGFLRYDEVGRLAFLEEPEIVLVLLRRGTRAGAFRLPVPPAEYGGVRKLIAERAREGVLQLDTALLGL